MRFLADENIPYASVRWLREKGFEVLYVAEHHPGKSDREVWTMAGEMGALLLTFDRDFGLIRLGAENPKPKGIVYMRFQPTSPEEPARLLLEALLAGLEPEGHFTVLEIGRVRIRPL